MVRILCFSIHGSPIVRHYLGESSPLGKTLERYADYFGLFLNFSGFVEFFLLQDIGTNDFSVVKFFAPFDGFKTSPLPSTTEAYTAYKELAVELIKMRNQRIFECFLNNTLEM